MFHSLTIRGLVVGILLMLAAAIGCSRQSTPPQADSAPSADQVLSVPVPVEDAVGESEPPATAPPGSLQEMLDNQPPPQSGEEALAELGYRSPAERLLEKLAPPPQAVRLSKTSPLWIDIQSKRLFVDGIIAQREAYLEMFACDAETKEHESVVGVAAKSSEVHAALLAIGGQVGKTVRFDPEYTPATGQRIRVWVMWRDEQGDFQATDARQWVRNTQTKQALDRDWVFAGSTIWKDPSDGKEYYQADSGEMICVSNFSTALMDLPIESSDSNNQLQFEAFTERIPPPGTFVRLMLVPLADDQPATAPDDHHPDESMFRWQEAPAS